MDRKFLATAGRQHVACAVQKFDGAEGTIKAGAVDGIELPGGAIPLRAFVLVVTPFLPATTVKAGDLAAEPPNDTLYGTLNLSAAAGSRTVVPVPNMLHEADTKLTFEFSAEPTEGEAYYVIEYIVAGRSHFAFGGKP